MAIPGIPLPIKQKMLLSKETLTGLRITGITSYTATCSLSARFPHSYILLILASTIKLTLTHALTHTITLHSALIECVLYASEIIHRACSQTVGKR